MRSAAASANPISDAVAATPAPPPDRLRDGRNLSGARAEVGIGLSLAAALTWLSLVGWRFYDQNVRPYARIIPTATVTVVPDPEAVREQARRMRQVADHLGAGMSFREAGRRDLAIQEFREALTLDPANYDARENLRSLGVVVADGPVNTPVPPTPTIIPTATPRR